MPNKPDDTFGDAGKSQHFGDLYFLGRYLDQRFDKLEHLIADNDTKLEKRIEALRTDLDRKEKQTMSALTDLSEAMDSQAHAQAAQAAALTNIAADIARLQKQIADGGGITEAQLQPVADKAKAAAVASTQFAEQLKALADSVPDEAPPNNPIRSPR